MATPAFLTEKQVAELTQVSVRTLQDWRRRKQPPLEFVKFGRSVRYPAAQFERKTS